MKLSFRRAPVAPLACRLVRVAPAFSVCTPPGAAAWSVFSSLAVGARSWPLAASRTATWPREAEGWASREVSSAASAASDAASNRLVAQVFNMADMGCPGGKGKKVPGARHRPPRRPAARGRAGGGSARDAAAHGEAECAEADHQPRGGLGHGADAQRVDADVVGAGRRARVLDAEAAHRAGAGG